MTPKEIFDKAKTVYGNGNYKNYPIDDFAEKIALEAIRIAQQEVIFISAKPDAIKSVCVCKNPKTFQIHREYCYKCTLEVNP